MSDHCAELRYGIDWDGTTPAADRAIVTPPAGKETLEAYVARILKEHPPQDEAVPDKTPWTPPPPGANLGCAHDCKPVERVILEEIMRRRVGHGIKAPDLAALAKTTERDARDWVEHLRQVHELPIGGNPSELYFWPRTRAELQRTIASLRSRQNNINKTIKGIIAGADRRFGRELLEEE